MTFDIVYVKMADTLLSKDCDLDVNHLVYHYFSVRPKFKYKEICSIVTEHHSRDLTMSRLIVILKEMNLNIKRNVSTEILEKIIKNELILCCLSSDDRVHQLKIWFEYSKRRCKESVEKSPS